MKSTVNHESKKMKPKKKSSGNSSSTTSSHNHQQSDSCKNYAGISGRSVKCYWEQHNNNEMDCTEDVYQRVAEDVTYKLWELGNAIKVYSRHAGGDHVTVDLVNEVLKDMNINPVLGANSSNWDTIECYGNYYFNSDRSVYLREEYLQEYHLEQPGPSAVTSSWVVEDQISDDLLDLFDKLCDAIFLGDEETFLMALELAGCQPFICGILSLLLNKCTELLAFDYKQETLERTMRLLIALSQNEFLDQNNVNLELYYLSQILVNLLLGAECFDLPKGPNSVSDLFDQHQIHQKNGLPQETQTVESGNFTNIDANLIFNTGQEVSQDTEMVEMKALQQHPQAVFNGIDGNLESKNELEELFIMMENNEFGMKRPVEDPNFHQQQTAKSDGDEILEGYQNNSKDAYNSAHLQVLTAIKEESSNFELQQSVKVDMEKLPPVEPNSDQMNRPDDEDRESTSTDEVEAFETESEDLDELCVIVTKMCDIEDVPLVCQCLGRLTGFWSYMYRESSYQVLKRIEQFFLSGVILLKCEYEWLIRATQTVWALGEVPFREFSVYLDKLHLAITPEWVAVHFNCCGVFLKDERDQKLYEIMSELCGDAILPFMLYRFKIMKQLGKVTTKSGHATFRIEPKVMPKLLHYQPPASVSGKPKTRCDLDTMFAGRRQFMRRQRVSTISFKFAGCRPVAIKRPEPEQKPPPAPMDSVLRNRIVLANRRLLRPLTNQAKQFPNVYDLSFVNL